MFECGLGEVPALQTVIVDCPCFSSSIFCLVGGLTMFQNLFSTWDGDFPWLSCFWRGQNHQPTNQPSIASVNDSLTQHVAHWWQMATVWLHVPPCIGVVCGPPPSQWKKWFPMVWVNECKWSMMLPSIIHSTFLRKATTPLQKQKQAGKYRYQKRKKHISHHLSNYLLNSPCLMVLKC